MEAVILAGGLGTRLRSICSHLPKPMVDVQGKPFLEHLMRYWKTQGVSHFILSVGYLHEKISSYFGDSFEGVPIDYAIEQTPAGTGGGLLGSLGFLHVMDGPILVVNGDTHFRVCLRAMRHFHEEHDSLCSFALFFAVNNTRYGGIKILPSGQILSMEGSLEGEASLINGGCYLMQPQRLQELAETVEFPFSLERDLFPGWIARGECYGFVTQDFFIDIGVPEDYLRFLEMQTVSDLLSNR